MPLPFSSRQFKRLPPVLSGAIVLAGFLIILAGLNIFQYFKAKENIATANLIQLSDIEFNEIQSFFNTVSDRLDVVREWGRNGLLEVDNVVALNKKFFPLLKENTPFTGLLLADSTGSEYYLYRQGGNLLTRSCAVGNGTTAITWHRWKTPDQFLEQWTEKSDYDPRKRPWFITPQQSMKVHWTRTYTFFQTEKPGTTASVSWVNPDNPKIYSVFGIDILAEKITGLLAEQEQKRTGFLFLFNEDENYFLESTAPASADVDKSGSGTRRKNIISSAINAWQAKNSPPGDVVPFQYDNRKWLIHFKPLSDRKNHILLGVIASEEDLAAGLKKILLQIDLTDIVAGVGGGLFLLYLTWRFGWRGTAVSRKRKTPDELRKIIAEGENAHLEFKSTIRLNLRTGKTGKEIELAWLKAVASFLNTDGGILLLGIGDDGAILGTDRDNFESDDRCLLHVKNLVNQHIGAEYSRFVKIYPVRLKTSRVVVVECLHSCEPVFLNIGKNEEFYIRSGPSSTKLSPSQIISYLAKNR